MKETLHKFPDIFGGGLGESKGEKAQITLKSSVKLYSRHYYNIPNAYKEPIRKEIKSDRMVKIGVLKNLKWNDDSRLVLTFFFNVKEDT